MFNRYPYLDLHELNLDMLLNMMRELHHDWDEFTAVNKITNAGAWDITKQYQAWTVVSDNNIGYISLKPVPAGVAITNIEYWGVIADYDILITDLSNRISQLEAAVPEKVDKLRAKKILLVSDSYGNLRNAANKTYVDLASEYLGINITHIQVGGSSFLGYLLDPQKRWEYILDNYTGDDPESFTDVYLVGGANDIPRAQADIETAMASFMIMFKNKYINAECHIVDFGITFTYTSYIDRKDKQLPAYHNAAKYGMSYVNGAEFTLNDNNLFTGDPTHCNADGVDAMGNALAQAILNGEVNIEKHEQFTSQWLKWDTWDMTQFSVNNGTIYHSLRDGVEKVYTLGAGLLASVYFSARSVPTRGNYADAFYFPKTYAVATLANAPVLECDLILVDNGGNVKHIPCRLYQTSIDASTYGIYYGISMYDAPTAANIVQMYILIPPFTKEC